MGNRYFDLGNLVGQQRLRRPRRTARCSSCTSRSPSTERRFAALQLMRLMSDFREAMWGVVQHGALRRSTSTSPPTRPSTSTGSSAPRRDPRVRGVAGRCRDRVSCPSARASSSSAAAWAARRSPTTSPQLGERDVVLVDRAELTSGSTFHSAGLVGQLRGSVSLTRMMMDSVELYRRLGDACGLDRVRRPAAGLHARARGGAAPPGRLGADVRAAARADLGRRGAGALPADVDRRRARRRPTCRPTATSIPRS